MACPERILIGRFWGDHHWPVLRRPLRLAEKSPALNILPQYPYSEQTDQHDQESRTHFLDVAEGYFELTCKEIANAHVGSTPDDDHESVDDNKRAGADSGIASQRSGHVTVQMVDGLASSEGAGAMLRWARTAAER